MDILERINELAKEIASEYPNIESVDTWEKLYAIESSYKGTEASLQDWMKIAYILRDKLGMSQDELVALWAKEIK